MTKYLIYSILWSMAGDGRLKSRQELGDFIKGITDVPLPPTANMLIIDYEVNNCIIVSCFSFLIFQVFSLICLTKQTCNIKQYSISGTQKPISCHYPLKSKEMILTIGSKLTILL